MYKKRRTTIRFTRQDIADAAKVSLSKVYKDTQRGKVNPKSLISIVQYITGNNT